MTDLDFDQLQADQAAVTVALLTGKPLHDEPFTSEPLTGFAVLAGVQVVVKVDSVRGARVRSLVVTVEGSTDGGDTWETLDGCEFEFSQRDTQRASVAAPADWLRVTCTPGVGMRAGYISSVQVVPLYLNTAA